MSGIFRSAVSTALAVGVILVIGSAAPAASAVPEQPPLAGSVLDAAASANEIDVILGTGERTRIDPHPPLPLDGAWSPDGKQIAFSGYGDNKARGIYVMNARGTDVRLLFEPPEPSNEEFRPYWSPDGRTIAFVVDGLGPWIIAADGGPARRLADDPIDVFSAPIAWSPNGRTLAFGSGKNGALYTIRADGTHLRRLTRAQSVDAVEEGAELGFAAWSPDGKRIAFVRYTVDNSPPKIEAVDANGGRERLLARGYVPAWSPDGSRLAFFGGGGISVVSIAGGRPRLIANPRGTEWVPVWTPDGRRVVFVSAPSRRVYVADAEHGGARLASAHLRVVPDTNQFWSSDAKFLDGEGDFNQRSANPVGAEPASGNAVVRILTPTGVASTFRWSTDDAPAWSPDGARLAFVRTARTKTIYIAAAGGGSVQALTQGHNPVWSPDGTAIVFERRGAIFVVAATGGRRSRRIAAGYDPAWSPDGRMLAFDDRGIFVAPASGGAARRLVAPYTELCDGEGPAQFVPERPAWSHDGRLIVFDEGLDSDCPYVDMVASDGTSFRHVAEGSEPQWTPDDSEIVFLDFNGHLMTVGPDGQGRRMVTDHDFLMSFSITSDGGLIVYSRWPCTRTNCTNEIWITRADGSARWPLLQGSVDTDPAWRPG